jgi:hypothetical protein
VDDTRDLGLVRPRPDEALVTAAMLAIPDAFATLALNDTPEPERKPGWSALPRGVWLDDLTKECNRRGHKNDSAVRWAVRHLIDVGQAPTGDDRGVMTYGRCRLGTRQGIRLYATPDALLCWRNSQLPDPTLHAQLLAEKMRSAGYPSQAVEGGMTEQPSPPVRYLWNWREILDALGMVHDDENIRRVREANLQYDGPIILPRKGGRPKVVAAELLKWWNELLEIFRESAQREADTDATLQDRHDYGRHGTVLPNIGGHVKKRRGTKGG